MSNDPELAERRGRVDRQLGNHEERLDEHDQRLTKLERFMYIVVGAIAVLSMMYGSSALVGVLL